MIKGLQNLAPADWALLYANDALEPDEVTFVEAELQKYPDLLAKVNELRGVGNSEPTPKPTPKPTPEPIPDHTIISMKPERKKFRISAGLRKYRDILEEAQTRLEEIKKNRDFLACWDRPIPDQSMPKHISPLAEPLEVAEELQKYPDLLAKVEKVLDAQDVVHAFLNPQEMRIIHTPPTVPGRKTVPTSYIPKDIKTHLIQYGFDSSRGHIIWVKKWRPRQSPDPVERALYVKAQDIMECAVKLQKLTLDGGQDSFKKLKKIIDKLKIKITETKE
ncbi:MAG: hypothetical protein K6C40_14695 [Thermoguttaceae bacterium]|nr:hypothetical protein [Thermoguttaceae bacterium]